MQPGFRFVTEKYFDGWFRVSKVRFDTFFPPKLGLGSTGGCMTMKIGVTGTIFCSLEWASLLFCNLLSSEPLLLSSVNILSSRNDSFGAIKIS